MQTIYYNTTHFVCHQNNVIDLEQYRRKQMLVQEGSLAPQPQEKEFYSFIDQEQMERKKPFLQDSQPHRPQKLCRAVLLDICASLGVVVMTLTFTLRVLTV